VFSIRSRGTAPCHHPVTAYSQPVRPEPIELQFPPQQQRKPARAPLTWPPQPQFRQLDVDDRGVRQHSGAVVSWKQRQRPRLRGAVLERDASPSTWQQAGAFPAHPVGPLLAHLEQAFTSMLRLHFSSDAVSIRSYLPEKTCRIMKLRHQKVVWYPTVATKSVRSPLLLFIGNRKSTLKTWLPTGFHFIPRPTS
jgi:hypothetical protein